MNENKNRATFQSRLGFILVFRRVCHWSWQRVEISIHLRTKRRRSFSVPIPYLLVLLGLPILICEFAIGRGSNRSLSQAFNRLEKPGSRYHCTKYTSIAGNYLLMMFYTMVTGWMLYYAFKYATGSFGRFKHSGNG